MAGHAQSGLNLRMSGRLKLRPCQPVGLQRMELSMMILEARMETLPRRRDLMIEWQSIKEDLTFTR